MSDLARRRNARDLWISRSHLAALGVGTAVLSATTFAVGFSLSAGREAERVPASLLSEVPDDRLVELLARVEASEDPLGGIASLTFPEDLSRVPEPILPIGPPLPPGVGPVEPAAPAVSAPPIEPIVIHGAPPAFAPVSDPPPPGSFTAKVAEFEGAAGANRAVALRASLRAAGLEAWVATRLEGGVPRYRVAVGAYPDEASAARIREAILEIEPDLTVEVVAR
jgi:hypothetical protein